MAPTSGGIPEYEPPAYEVGKPLLVSGEPRWGGAPLKDAIAWSCGGFTRYYEPSVAAEWRTATSQAAVVGLLSCPPSLQRRRP